LFHEFGTRYTLINKIELYAVSGLMVWHGCCELPRQFLENMGWRPRSLKLFIIAIMKRANIQLNYLSNMLGRQKFSSRMHIGDKLNFHYLMLNYIQNLSRIKLYTNIASTYSTKNIVFPGADFNRST